MNISSVVVKCAPQYVDAVTQNLSRSGLCDVYAADELGRIVVVLEGETSEDEGDKLKQIQKISHVLSAEMVYAYSEDEYNADDFDTSGVLATLNSDMPAELIKYNGHLKGM